MNEVKLVCSVITGRTDLLDRFRDALVGEYGPIDMGSDIFPFDYTDYYEEEMGPLLVRRLFAFENHIDAGTIADIKLKTIEMEKELTRSANTDVARVVNFDPGYVDLAKFVLATTKDRAHRIYLRDGIFAEVTLQYVGSGFQPVELTYPDYRQENYREFLNGVRERFRTNYPTT